MTSMYKDYVENQLPNRFVHEDTNGFLTYTIINGICILEEIYVKPESRRKGIASQYYDLAYDVAREASCDSLRGSIVIGTIGAEDSMKCLFKNGYKLDFNNGNVIYLKKEIGE